MSEFPSREEFREWVTGQEPDAVVGAPWNPYDCPLARHLRLRGVAEACVVPTAPDAESGFWRERPLGPAFPLPRWADLFARSFDEALDEDSLGTAKHALGILDDLDVIA